MRGDGTCRFGSYFQMSDMIGQERRGATLIVTIDNPAKGNALTLGMLDALEDCAITVERDRTIRAVVITGAGEKAFCTGADINEWSALDAAQFSREWVPKGHRLFDRLARLPVPLIAAVNGMAFGGGLELLATSDLRIAAPHAQFALPETTIGIVPGWSGAQRLAALVPQAVLREMALAGSRISAERMHQVGFLNEISPDPMAAALVVAERIATLSPRALEATKLVLNAANGEGTAAALDSLSGALIAASSDKAEGVASFKEKRKPNFRD